MARNQEKAQTLLARWIRMQQNQDKPKRKRRPVLAESCDNLEDAKKFRGQIIRETTKAVSAIQNGKYFSHS